MASVGVLTASALSTGATAAATTAAITAVATSAALTLSAQYAYASLASPELIEGPRLDGLTVQQVQEGSPINYALGNRTRMEGTIIWVNNKLIEQRVTKDIDSGTLTPAQTLVSFKYFAHLAIGVCEGEILQIDKIWADGRLLKRVFNTETAGPSTEISLTKEGLFFLSQAKLDSPVTGPDLSVFRAGQAITFAGFSNSENNGIYICIARKTNTDGSTTLRAWKLFPIPITESAGASVTITQLLLDFPFTTPPPTIFKGDQVQDPIAIIQDQETAAKTPAYRGLAYVFFNMLPLEEYGNRIPRFAFEVKQAATTVALLIDTILLRGGLTSSDFDTSAVTSTTQGFLLTAPTSTLRSLEPILLAYNIVVQEKDGKLFFSERGDQTEHSISEADLAAHETKSDSPRKVVIADIADFDLPTQVNVGYIDPKRRLQRGQQRERGNLPAFNTTLTFDLPITLNAQAARDIARRILWTAWTNRQTIILSLPPSYIGVKEHDILNVTANSITYRILISQIDRGDNFILLIQGFIESAVTLTGFTAGVDDEDIDDDVDFPGAPIGMLIDIAPLVDRDVNRPGLYIAAANFDPTAPWFGGDWYSSPDDTDYDFRSGFFIESEIGQTSTLLADGPLWYWDYKSTVQVTMYEGVLLNAIEEKVYEGINFALVGSEVIAFQNATLQGDGSYILGTLLRGLRNTQMHTAGHVAVEKFVMLKQDSIQFLDIPTQMLGVSEDFKVIAPTGDLDDAEKNQHTHVLGTLRQFTIEWVQTRRWIGGSVSVPQFGILWISWIYRTRRPLNRWPREDEASQDPGAGIPGFLDTLSVIVEVHGSEPTLTGTETPIRKWSFPQVSGLLYNTIAYATSDQIDDGVLPADLKVLNVALWLRIYHVDVLGRRGPAAVEKCWDALTDPLYPT